MLFQPPLDETYTQMPLAEAGERIAARKAELGEKVCILGHHYQCDEVFAFADFTGDSLKLSRQATEATAPNIVFCGVHFMAESADILTGGQRNVILPDLAGSTASGLVAAGTLVPMGLVLWSVLLLIVVRGGIIAAVGAYLAERREVGV